MNTIDPTIAGLALVSVAIAAAWSLCRTQFASRGTRANSALAVSRGLTSLAVGAVLLAGGCSDPQRSNAGGHTAQANSETEPPNDGVEDSDFPRDFTLYLLRRRWEEYRGLLEDLALVRIQVENLKRRCPPHGTAESCRARYMSMYGAIDRGLNSLTVNVAMVLVPDSRLGRSIDNAYLVKRHYDWAWTASDETYAFCQHGEGDDSRCVDERSVMFEPFSQCILHSACLLGEHLRQTDKAELELVRAVFDGATEEEVAAALVAATDSLEFTAQDAEPCDPKGDVIVERVCDSPDFLSAGTEQQVEVLCEVWNERYAGQGYTPPAFLEGCAAEYR